MVDLVLPIRQRLEGGEHRRLEQLGRAPSTPSRADWHGGGGSAIVLARPTNIDAPVRVALAPQIRQAVEGLHAHGWDGSTASRLVIFGGDADGYLRQVEIAVDPE